MQIFRNIPTLFEYFLDVLEQRVEILEKDDISVFQEGCEAKDGCEKNTIKREVGHYLTNIKNSLIDEKKIDDSNAGIYHTSNKLKIDNSKAMDRSYTTEKHEYGQSISQYPNPNKKSLSDSKATQLNDMAKRDIIKNEFINKPLEKHIAVMKNHNTKSISSTEIPKIKHNIKKNKHKRESYLQLRKALKGIDWSQLYLSPEEVEEKAIKTEQIIEDHNNKGR